MLRARGQPTHTKHRPPAPLAPSSPAPGPGRVLPSSHLFVLLQHLLQLLLLLLLPLAVVLGGTQLGVKGQVSAEPTLMLSAPQDSCTSLPKPDLQEKNRREVFERR